MRERFDQAAAAVSRGAGSPAAFALAVVTVLAWAMSGPMFAFSATWQLVINTGTTIVTFLMVFLIQSAQNRDATAIHVKLDELIRASDARDEIIDIEEVSSAVLERFKAEFHQEHDHGQDT